MEGEGGRREREREREREVERKGERETEGRIVRLTHIWETFNHSSTPHYPQTVFVNLHIKFTKQ